MKKAQVLVAVANGTEELEAVTIIDILRRANIDVRVSSIQDRTISCALNTRLIADSELIDEVFDDYDALILPGGTEGAKNFAEYGLLIDELKKFLNEGKIVAAICASPALVLADHGLLEGKKATCYPAMKSHIKNYVDQPVVIEGSIITSQGPGTAIAFALTLVEILAGKVMLNEVKKGMLLS